MRFMFPRLKGKYSLVFYHSYNEGHRGLLSFSHNELKKRVQVLCNNLSFEFDTTIKEYHSIEVVRPPQQFLNQLDALQEKELERMFWDTISWNVKYPKDREKYLSGILGLCKNYGSPQPSSLDDDNETEETDPDHYSCTNCKRGIVVTNGESFEQFYEGKKSFFAEEYITSYNLQEELLKKPSTIEFLAQCLSENSDEQLYYITGSFGSHSSGLSLNPYNKDEPIFWNDEILFFCRLLPTQPTSEQRDELTQILSTYKAKLEEKRKKSLEKTTEERLVQEKKERELFLKLLAAK